MQQGIQQQQIPPKMKIMHPKIHAPVPGSSVTLVNPSFPQFEHVAKIHQLL